MSKLELREKITLDSLLQEKIAQLHEELKHERSNEITELIKYYENQIDFHNKLREKIENI